MILNAMITSHAKATVTNSVQPDGPVSAASVGKVVPPPMIVGHAAPFSPVMIVSVNMPAVRANARPVISVIRERAKIAA